MLVKGGVLYDVITDWKPGSCVNLRSDGVDGIERVSTSVLGQFKLVRPAPGTEDIPVMSDARDARRRERLDFGWLEKT